MERMKFWGALYVLTTQYNEIHTKVMRKFFDSYNNPPEEKDAPKMRAFAGIMMLRLVADGYIRALPA